MMAGQVNVQGGQSAAIPSRVLEGVRIARISTVPYFVLSQLKNQIEFIRDNGARITIVSADGPEFPSLQAIEGVTCERVEISRSISLWQDTVAAWQLFRLFRRHNIDVAHSTTPKAGLLTAIAAFLAGVPIRLHTFTGQQWLNMRGPVRWLSRLSDWLIARLNTRCYADSVSQRQFLLQQGLAPENKLFVIGAGSLAGVDLNRFNPERFGEQERRAIRQGLGVPDAAPVLLFVGRITTDKGVRELLEAFRRLKADANPAHLVVAGHFDSEIGGGGGIARQDFENIPDVHIVGYTEHPEYYMSIADLLCLPSYREGFGTVVIEAAAMGVPTVGSDIYGLSDAVANGVSGVLIPPRNAAELTKALATLLADDKMRGEMGRAARARAMELFEAGLINGKLVDEYCSLLHRTGWAGVES